MEGCEVCEILDGKREGIHNERYIIDFENGWALNHCNASNAYLGYLVLSATKRSKHTHIKDFIELDDKDLRALGLTIRWVNSQLKQYWAREYTPDRIEQICLAYLNESPYKKKMSEGDVSQHLHVHIHILPRTEAMRNIADGQMLGWDLLKTRDCFPINYLLNDGRREKLMEHLKQQSREEVKIS